MIDWDCEIQPHIEPFFDSDSNTFSYLVQDPNSLSCAVIDSVLDFDYPSGSIGYESADGIIDIIKRRGLDLQWLIETHVHADHLSAAPYIQEKLGGQIMISQHIAQVQEEFGRVFNEGTRFQRDGSQFDKLLKDDEHYYLGELPCIALYTPGHTPACMTHVLGNSAFVGDTLFMPDGGTARADFPGGCAQQLYQSIQRVLELSDDTALYMCHDYQPNGRELECRTTVADHRANNVHVGHGISQQDYVQMRLARDKTLGMPRLILPALQVNMRAGHFPVSQDNGTVYLKIPINGLKPALITEDS